ncbi:MAG: amidohydrolase family protein [Vicinamibacterales bacterium]
MHTPSPRPRLLGRTSWVAALAVSAAIARLPGDTITRAQSTTTFDVLVTGGRVLDGTGNPWRYADIGIRGDRIVAMGTLAGATAARVVDASGLLVSPGFIDVHSHAGPRLAKDLNRGEPLLAQGITTAVVSPDGGGPVNLAPLRAAYESQGTGVNVAIFAPHGSIREAVLGMADRAPTPAELAKMVELVRTAMRDGAIGLSSGLYYAPGSYAATDEVIALAKAAAEGGGVYESHIRDEGDYSVGLVAAVDEVIRIAEEAKLPGIVTHMKALGQASWGLSHQATTHIEAARARGVQAYADQYPYEASGTGIVGALVPRWAEVGGRDMMRERIFGPERAKFLAEVRANIARRGGAHALQFSRYAPDPAIEGKRLDDVAKAMGKPPEEAALDLLAKGDAGLVSFNMSERDIEHIMRQDYTMTCTDGDLVSVGEGKPHPRAYGAFARKLKRYVRERGTVEWGFAVRSMTSLPADVFGMKDRGVLRPGAFADVLVFDEHEVGDEATYVDPHHLSVGMKFILVNGVLVRDRDAFTGALPGKVVTPQRR